MVHVRKSQRGFTLVELSIVLVIIGLIVSSVLVGKDLIRAAELRATITQYEGFNAAIGTFKVSHNNMLPGDVRGQTDYGYVGNGDGDGVLTDGTFTNHANADVRNAHGGEFVYFWNHLGSTGANLVSGAYTGIALANTDTTVADRLPTAKAGGNWGVYSANGTNYFVLGATIPAAGTQYSTTNVLNPADAASLDAKIDDGRPVRGVVQAHDGSATDPNTAPEAGAGGAGSGDCVDAATVAGVYHADSDEVDCTLSFTLKM